MKTAGKVAVAVVACMALIVLLGQVRLAGFELGIVDDLIQAIAIFFAVYTIWPELFRKVAQWNWRRDK